MSLLDLASLVLAPTATKEGKVYSAIPDTGDGDMTFSRGSAATRVNSAGLIEKERGNLLLQSNTFDTTWTNVNTSETSGQNGYDGTNNAWKLTKTAASGRLQQATLSAGLYCFSLYLKADTINWVQLYLDTTTATDPNAFFDLQNGLVGSTNDNIDASIEDVGNGWYRCSLVGNASTTFTAMIFPAEADNDKSATSGSILIQDAQLEQGLVAQSYIETTTTAVYEGITDDVPRVDYSGGGCPALKLEPQRTNLFPQSEYLKDTTHWQVTNVSFSVNQGTSPEGQNNAIKVVPNSTGAAFWLDNTTLTSGQPYVLSFYAKSNGWDYLQVTNSSGVGGSEKENFDIINGTSNGDYATGDAVIEEFGNGWYKIIVKGTANESTGRMIIALSSGLNMIRLGSVTPSGDDGVLLYGFQWEQGSYSTSYIPTYGVSSTRVADFFLKSNASNLIGQTEGTIFIEFTRENNSVGTFSISANNVGTRIYIGTNATGLICQVRNGYAQQAYFSTAQTEGTKYKCAIAYATNDFVLYMNGTQIGTDTSGTVPPCDTIRTDDAGGSNLNQPLSQAILFPTRLTNDQLADLTTL
jgi:hypothetical protein